MKKIFIIFLFLITAVILYVLFIRKPVINLYCNLQIENRINNYRRSVKRNGQIIAIEDENYLQAQKKQLLEKCLKVEVRNGLKPFPTSL